MRASDAQQKTDAFHWLHAGPDPLVLVNAWTPPAPASSSAPARAAIGTTSAGMAWSLGYADGERMPVSELIAACARICRVTGCR